MTCKMRLTRRAAMASTAAPPFAHVRTRSRRRDVAEAGRSSCVLELPLCRVRRACGDVFMTANELIQHPHHFGSFAGRQWLE